LALPVFIKFLIIIALTRSGALAVRRRAWPPGRQPQTYVFSIGSQRNGDVLDAVVKKTMLYSI
jgi:hypothetical protein